jgi:hypothetical protein
MDHEMLKPRVIVLAGLALLLLALRFPAVAAIGGRQEDPGIGALLRRPRQGHDRDDRPHVHLLHDVVPAEYGESRERAAGAQ